MIKVGKRLSRVSRMARYGTVMAAAALCAGVLVPLSAGASQAPAAGHSRDAWRHGPRLDHVFIIMLENHEADHVIGDPNTPFITSLASKYGQATDYYGVTHSSEPNYIAATSGDTWWTNDDNGWYTGTVPDRKPPIPAHQHRRPSWPSRPYPVGLPTWRPCRAAGYLPDSGPATGGALYASKHNPFILYNDVRFNPDARASTSSPIPTWPPT